MIKKILANPKPSISVVIGLKTRSAAPPEDLPLGLEMESNSSKNNTQGAAILALSNISLMFASNCSDCCSCDFVPIVACEWLCCFIANNSGHLMELKLVCHSFAIHLASNTLPQPGGPNKMAPRDGCTPNLRNFSGCTTGYCANSRSSFLISCKPLI